MREERARPSVGKHQRKWIRPSAGDSDGVDHLPTHVDRPVLQPVDPSLQDATVASRPLPEQLVEPTGRNAEFPAALEWGRTLRDQATAQFHKGSLFDDWLEAAGSDRSGHGPILRISVGLVVASG